MKKEYIDNILPIYHFLAGHHRYQVNGLNHIPKKGPAIIVVNHSLATYDSIMLGAAVYLQTGRLAYGLADRNFFKFNDVMAQFFRGLNLVEGNHENAEKLLEEGNLIMLAPGGMSEALRSSKERYQIKWGKRLGIAKLAIKSQIPIIMAACPAADDIYDVYTGSLTKLFYQKFKLPFFMAKGFGPTLFPRPVQLIHSLSRPLIPPKVQTTDNGYEEKLNFFHSQLIKSMERLMDQSRNYAS
jgi:1-acyl-sn-glycerol-3-phosphate acyltransferase